MWSYDRYKKLVNKVKTLPLDGRPVSCHIATYGYLCQAAAVTGEDVTTTLCRPPYELQKSVLTHIPLILCDAHPFKKTKITFFSQKISYALDILITCQIETKSCVLRVTCKSCSRNFQIPSLDANSILLSKISIISPFLGKFKCKMIIFIGIVEHRLTEVVASFWSCYLVY